MDEFLAHPAAKSGLAIAIALIFALALDRLLLRGLLRLAGRTETVIDDALVDLLRAPLLVTILALGLRAALAPLGLADTPQFIAAASIKTVVIIVWSRALFRGSAGIMNALGRDDGLARWFQARTIPLFDILAKILIVGSGLYLVLVAWRINVTGWLASAGIVGIAVGFAAKDTLANLFAGIFILADAPYKVGDTIVLDDGTRGIVTDIGIRSTRVLTRDAVEITVPNALIGNSKIRNESGGPTIKTRLKLGVGVAYGSDLAKVKELLIASADGVSGLADSPTPTALFMEMADSALQFELVVWLHNPQTRDNVVDQLNTRIYDTLNAAGIEIPFPQRDVHVRAFPNGKD